MSYAHLAGNVRRLRHEREMSQAALGEAVGVPQSYVSLIERGLSPWREQHIDAFARALGVTREVLIAAPIELGVRTSAHSERLRSIAV